MVGQPEAKKKKPRKKVRYEHKKVAFEFLLVIWDTKMEDEVKMIMTFRIWGKDPNRYKPMTHEEIAAYIGDAPVALIKDGEVYGKKCAKEHLLKNTLQEIKGRCEAAGGPKNFFRTKGSIVL